MFLFLLFSLWFSEEKPDQIPKVDESLEVNYVLLDVAVTGRDGTHIKDLTKSDFSIYENKRPVDIQLFDRLDYLDSAGFAPRVVQGQTAPSEEQKAVPRPQTLILMLEMATAQPDTLKNTLAQVREFLYQLRGRSNLAIFIFSLEKGIITRRFTSSPDLALIQFDRFQEAYLKDPTPRWDMARQTSLFGLEEALEDCFQTAMFGISGGAGGAALGAGTTRSEVQGHLLCLSQAFDSYLVYQNRRTSSLLEALDMVVEGFSKVKGLKSLYLISPGFSLHPGRSASEMAREYQRRILQATSSASANSSGGQSQRPIEVAFTPESYVDRYKFLVQEAARHRIIFNTFTVPLDLEHKRQNPALGDGALRGNASQYYGFFGDELNEGLMRLAQTTGGIHRNGRQLAREISTSLEDNRFFYVLGYEKPTNRPKKYRKIKITCNRPGAQLRYREGYHPNPRGPKRVAEQ